jgi:antitoxin ParD1/3/4
MTMHINLSEEMESFIKAQVSSGFYGNATEVIRDAIRRMKAETERVNAFRRAVAAGDAELERGEFSEYTPELMEGIAQKARNNLHSNEPLDPDVLP